MNNKEIEFKYNADGISIDDFREVCNKRNPLSYLVISGHDHFYYNKDRMRAFWRHRIGDDTNQLTFKEKLNDTDSFIRIEHNIDLDLTTTQEKIEAFCKDLGYMYNTTIFKTSFIYFYDWYIVAYYICYDNNMKEIGRFMEIEVREDYDWPSEEDAWKELLVLEKMYSSLGISSKTRLKENLFEMFKRPILHVVGSLN